MSALESVTWLVQERLAPEPSQTWSFENEYRTMLADYCAGHVLMHGGCGADGELCAFVAQTHQK